MLYKTNIDLPEQIKNILPEHAQDIYRAAFNHAWNEYEDPNKRRNLETREQVAYKIAWSAVKKKFIKIDNKWQLKK